MRRSRKNVSSVLESLTILTNYNQFAGETEAFYMNLKRMKPPVVVEYRLHEG